MDTFEPEISFDGHIETMPALVARPMNATLAHRLARRRSLAQQYLAYFADCKRRVERAQQFGTKLGRVSSVPSMKDALRRGNFK